MENETNNKNLIRQIISQFESNLRMLRDLGYINQKGLTDTVSGLYNAHDRLETNDPNLYHDVDAEPDLAFNGIKIENEAD